MNACISSEHSANAVHEEAAGKARLIFLPQAQCLLRHRQDALAEQRDQALLGFRAETLQRVGGDLAQSKNTYMVPDRRVRG